MTVADASEAYKAALKTLSTARANHSAAKDNELRELDALDQAMLATDSAWANLRDAFVAELVVELAVSTT